MPSSDSTTVLYSATMQYSTVRTVLVLVVIQPSTAGEEFECHSATVSRQVDCGEQRCFSLVERSQIPIGSHKSPATGRVGEGSLVKSSQWPLPLPPPSPSIALH